MSLTERVVLPLRGALNLIEWLLPDSGMKGWPAWMLVNSNTVPSTRSRGPSMHRVSS